MRSSLRDLLARQAAEYATVSEQNRLIVEEWKAAVDRLLSRLEEWLDSADPEKILQRHRGSINVTEPSLGRYVISTLNLRAFGKEVDLIPKARRTGKRAGPQQKGAPEPATGRVDMTDEIRRYVLYRFGQGAEEQWFLDDPALNTNLQPLTAERFEAALVGYFQ